ncbi:MAG: type II secretion system F family protein, partial [Sulfobacillus sp.]
RFAQLITQSERAGSNISQALQIQGRHIKQVRIAAVREKAAALPVKMLFPLVFFMFPAMFVVILAPGLLKILHHF